MSRSPECPTCGTRLRQGACPQGEIASLELPNPARYHYGALVDRQAVDEHLRAEVEARLCDDGNCPLFALGVWGHPVRVHAQWGLPE